MYRFERVNALKLQYFLYFCAGWSPDQYKNQSELRENGCCLGKTLEIYDDTESNVPTHQRSQPGHYYSRAESLTSPGKSLLSPSWRKSQHSPTSHIFEYDSISSVSPKSPNLFLFPPSKPGLSSGSGNLLPSSRHSFRYNVHLPGTPSTKRRSLPEILLHFTQKPSRKSPASRRPSEFLVHVQDFDESEDFGSVGLKGSLGLPGKS